MTTHYLGTTKSGAIVSRKSTNPAFTHAACKPGFKTGDKPLPNFGTSFAGAARNYGTNYRIENAPEIVEVRKVDAAEYRAATKGA